MDKRKLKIALSLAVLIPCVLYAAGIIAQFIININAWKAAGSDYRTSPGLPSSQISEVVRALFHFPEGLIAIGVVVLGIAVLCVFGLRIGWGQNGVTDSDRNLTVSNSGSYGTASFMSPKEASACFEVTSAKRTSQDILGMLPDGQVLTLPKDTRLNANLAVCGSSGTGKTRAISRNLVLQAVKRGESVILTDPKSELYESMGEYLRENGYIVKVFNLVEMDHSDSWNCLGEVGSSELMAQTFADIVLQNTSGDSKDAFWYNAELNLLKALVLYTLTPNLDLATSHLPILLNIDRFPILILLAFEPLIRRGMLPLLLMEPASAWPWQKWSKRSWLSVVSVIVGAVLP